MRAKVQVCQSKSGKVIKIFNSITEAAKEVGGQESHISECANNKPQRHTHKGYEWSLVVEDESNV